MKGLAQKVIILTVCAFVLVLITSCREQQEQGGANEKMSRVVAAENMKLKKSLADAAKEIERLKQVNSSESKRQGELLSKCLEEKEIWEKRSEANVKEQVGEIVEKLMDENAKLREENENLKAKLAGKQ